MIQTENGMLQPAEQGTRKHYGRKSSLTDLDEESQAKLIADHEAANVNQSPVEIKMPSFGIEDVDHFSNKEVQVI